VFLRFKPANLRLKHFYSSSQQPNRYWCNVLIYELKYDITIYDIPVDTMFPFTMFPYTMLPAPTLTPSIVKIAQYFHYLVINR